MMKNLNTTMNTPETKQRLVDFFFIYYDAKVAKNVQRHPEVAIPMLKEALQQGLNSRERLGAYMTALRDAVALQGVAPVKLKKGAMSC